MFTGREYIAELGIYDYRHRFYHPALGRFLQMDPLGLQTEGAKLSAEQKALFSPGGIAPDAFTGSEMNLFRYCGDDPVNHSDPFGLEDSVTIVFVPPPGHILPLIVPDRYVNAAAGFGARAVSLMRNEDGLVTTATRDEKTSDIHVEQQIKITTLIKESEDRSGNTPELKGKELLRVDKFREGMAEAQRKANDLAAKGFKDVETARKQVEESTRKQMLQQAREGKLKWDLFGGGH
jgi:hypothetical protein